MIFKLISYNKLTLKSQLFLLYICIYIKLSKLSVGGIPQSAVRSPACTPGYD